MPRLPAILSLFSLLLALVLYFHAASLYSSNPAPHAARYRHLDNYWCDLCDKVTSTGQGNPGRPYALAATASLAFGAGR